MTDEQLELLLKARQSLSAARVLLDNGYPDYAVSRAYYTMFYIAEAFLSGEDMSFSRHSAVISAFGRVFASTGRVSVEFHRFLLKAQELRNAADYGQLNAVTAEQAEEQIIRAEQFLELAQNWIGTLPPSDNLEISSPSGERFLTFVELAQLREQERQRAEQERLRADGTLAQLEQERQRYQALEALLRERGINPEQL